MRPGTPAARPGEPGTKGKSFQMPIAPVNQYGSILDEDEEE